MASSLLSYAEAAAYISRYVHEHAHAYSERPAEQVPLHAALGRMLAEGVCADRDQPPFARSTRDGFACRAAEANTHLPLRLTGQIRAGQVRAGQIQAGLITAGQVGAGQVEATEITAPNLPPGEAWEIMTGAPVPAGADAVFMVEHAESSPGFVWLREPEFPSPARIAPGDNIVPQAAEAHEGDLLMPAGTRLSAAQIAVAAQCGYAQLTVYRRPRVAILSTGDELVAVDAIPGPSQIRNSNSPMLAALVEAAGAIPVVLPVARDTEEAVEESIRLAASTRVGADLLLFTGGISAGRFDLVEDALVRAGANFLFQGVAIQPGKPVAFGELPQGNSSPPLPFFALPGNPVSSAVTFHLFAAPLLAAFSENREPLPRFAQARMAAEWKGKSGLTRFLPAWCDFGLAAQVRLVPWQGSGDLAAFARSNCFLVVPATETAISDESLVSILLV